MSNVPAFCPCVVFEFSCDSYDKQIISVHGINRLIFVMEVRCVLHEVRPGSSPRKTRVGNRASPHEIHGGHNDTGRGFSPSFVQKG